MPHAAPRPCAIAVCPAVVRPPARYCPQHGPPLAPSRWQANVRGPRPGAAAMTRSGGAGGARALREPLCRACAGQGLVVAAREVDHIRPLAEGGVHAFDNLQPLCKPCHTRKTLRERAVTRGFLTYSASGWRAASISTCRVPRASMSPRAGPVTRQTRTRWKPQPVWTSIHAAPAGRTRASAGRPQPPDASATRITTTSAASYFFAGGAVAPLG